MPISFSMSISFINGLCFTCLASTAMYIVHASCQFALLHQGLCVMICSYVVDRTEFVMNDKEEKKLSHLCQGCKSSNSPIRFKFQIPVFSPFCDLDFDFHTRWRSSKADTVTAWMVHELNFGLTIHNSLYLTIYKEKKGTVTNHPSIFKFGR